MNKVFIPISIVVSGLIIAGAIYLTTKQQQPQSPVEENLELSISPVDETDHILGNPNAEIVIVEYSDYECPFCQGFHGTMNKIMEEYGPTGKVAWVYRHFPLTQIHPDAQPAAEAAECVAKLGGNEKFWEYSNLLYTKDTSLAADGLLEKAVTIGINEAEFKACLESDYPKQQVAKDVQDGNAIASVDKKFGTPYNILISKSTGVQIPIKGNQPYANVKGAIDAVLNGSNPQ